MKLSQDGRTFIAQFEGSSLTAYQCPAGIWTIGIGSTEPPVHPGDTITTDEMWERFARNIGRFEDAVSRGVGGTPTTQHQFDAMVSLAFNIGVAGFASSTVLRMHKAENDASAAAAFSLWNKATIGGALQVVPGLARRRAAEAAVYLTPVDAPHPMPTPAPVEPQSMPQSVAAPPPIPEGFVMQPSGNVMLSDLKDSTIVQKSNLGQVVTGGATAVATAGTAGLTIKSLLAGITVSDVGIIVIGVVLVVAMILAFLAFRSTKAARIDLHDRGIA